MIPVSQRASARMGPNAMHGITLIELMIVVVIIGILAAIAYPSYQNQVREARRTDGKTALLDTAQQLERCFTRYNAYNEDDCEIVKTLNDGGFDSPEDWYAITGVLNATTFTLTATARNDQVNDACGNLTLTQTGQRGRTGAAPVDECW